MAERIPISATIRVPIQAYLASDHITPATGVTIVITISKNGAAYANPSGGSTNATEIGSGSYYVDLSTTDTGTAGPLFVKGTSATIDNVIVIMQVSGAIPSAVAGAAGGLHILGDNVGATTYTGSSSPGITYTGASGHAGTRHVGTAAGYGVQFIGGATNNTAGIQATTSGTNGYGAEFIGIGARQGMRMLGGATGAGLSLSGGVTSGAALIMQNTSGDVLTITGSSTIGATTFASVTITGAVTATHVTNDFRINGAAAGANGGVPILSVSGTTLGYTVTTVSTVNALAANSVSASVLATDAVAEIADGVWDEAIAGHLTAGSTGLALSSAASAGDPWGTALPGAYAAGTAGHIIGTAIPDIAPGVANGLLRGGTNAASTFATLTVSGNTTVGGALTIASVSTTGNVAIGNNMTIAGDVSVSAGLVTLDRVSITGTITANAAANDITGVIIDGIAASPTGFRLAKNVALAGFQFPMFLTGTNTPATGKSPTAFRSLDGAAFAACANAPTELSNGVYLINLDAADTNGNTVTYLFSASGCDDTLLSGFTEGA